MPKIDQMFAFVIADKDEDDEGIPAFRATNGMTLPMVGADTARVADLKPHAQLIANEHGKPIKVLRFTHFEVVEVIQPEPKS